MEIHAKHSIETEINVISVNEIEIETESEIDYTLITLTRLYENIYPLITTLKL